VLKIDVGGAVGSKPLELKVATTNSISQVKDKLARQENIPAVQQDLLSGGASLSNDATVTSAGLQDGDTISLIRDPSIPTGTGSSGRKWSSQVLVVKYAGPDTGSDTHFELLKGYHERGAAGLGSLAGVALADGSTSDFGDANKYREKNPFHDYDKKWLSKKLDKKWRVYDEADWKEEIGDHVTEIMKPWTDYTKKANAHHHGKVPDAIYSHHPDYNNEDIDIAGKSILWKHGERVPEKSVIGSDYATNPEGWDHVWDVTPKSTAFKGNKDGTSGR